MKTKKSKFFGYTKCLRIFVTLTVWCTLTLRRAAFIAHLVVGHFLCQRSNNIRRLSIRSYYFALVVELSNCKQRIWQSLFCCLS
jgi:hypothetical protein